MYKKRFCSIFLSKLVNSERHTISSILEVLFSCMWNCINFKKNPYRMCMYRWCKMSPTHRNPKIVPNKMFEKMSEYMCSKNAKFEKSEEN